MCAWLSVTLCATSKVNGDPQSLVSLFCGSQAEKFGNHCCRGPAVIWEEQNLGNFFVIHPYAENEKTAQTISGVEKS